MSRASSPERSALTCSRSIVPALIRHALDAVTPAADAKGIRLEAELHQAAPRCLATPTGFSR